LFCTLYPSSNPTNKNVTDSNAKFKQFYLGNHSELDTFLWTFLLTVANTVTSQNIDLSLWITLYIARYRGAHCLRKTNSVARDFTYGWPPSLVIYIKNHKFYK
jgi:hypothetical protein